MARSFQGLITDWGGVLTSSIPAAVRAWLDSDDIDPDAYAAAVRPWRLAGRDPAGDGNPVHALERGEYDSGEFEQRLAALLDSPRSRAWTGLPSPAGSRPASRHRRTAAA